MLQLRVATTSALSGAVIEALEEDPAVSSLAVLPVWGRASARRAALLTRRRVRRGS